MLDCIEACFLACTCCRGCNGCCNEDVCCGIDGRLRIGSIIGCMMVGAILGGCIASAPQSVFLAGCGYGAAGGAGTATLLNLGQCSFFAARRMRRLDYKEIPDPQEARTVVTSNNRERASSRQNETSQLFSGSMPNAAGMSYTVQPQ